MQKKHKNKSFNLTFYFFFLLKNVFLIIFFYFRPDLLKPEVILPKLDSSMTQVTIPSKGSTSPGRSRRGKPRYRKAGKGSSGDLAQLKATLSSSLAMINSSVSSTKQRLDPTAAIRGLQHDLLLKKMSSSSPDLISTTLEAEGRRKGQLRPGLDRAGSQSASAGLEESRGPEEPADRPNVGVGNDDLVETPPRSDTPSEDAASIPFSSSPDSPCGRGATAGRTSVLGSTRVPYDGDEKEEGTVITRSPRSQRLTPAALLYRAAVTRSQVSPTRRKLFLCLGRNLKTFNTFLKVYKWKGPKCGKAKMFNSTDVYLYCYGPQKMSPQRKKKTIHLNVYPSAFDSIIRIYVLCSDGYLRKVEILTQRYGLSEKSSLKHTSSIFPQRRGLSSEEEEGEADSEVEAPRRR